MPPAYSAPTRLPGLVPVITLALIPLASSILITPMWAKPLAAPPPRARPMRGGGGGGSGAGTGAGTGPATRPGPPEAQAASRPSSRPDRTARRERYGKARVRDIGRG